MPAENIKIVAEIDERQLIEFNRTITFASRALRQSEEGTVRQAVFFFLQSVIKLTPPGAGTKLKNLPKKYKYRPMVTLPPDRRFFVYEKKDGTTFKVSQKLKKSRNLRLLYYAERAFKAWLDDGWSLIPYIRAKAESSSESRRKYAPDYRDYFNPKIKPGRIPYAGAAKAGWIGVYRLMGEFRKGEKTQLGTKASLYRSLYGPNGFFAIIANKVRYISKIAPGSVNEALRKAERRLNSIANRKAEREFNNNLRGILR